MSRINSRLSDEERRDQEIEQSLKNMDMLFSDDFAVLLGARRYYVRWVIATTL